MQGPNGAYALCHQARHDGRHRAMSRSRRPRRASPVIDKGLDAGEQIVVDGQYRLDQGSKVAPQRRRPAQAAEPPPARDQLTRMAIERAAADEHLRDLHPPADRHLAADAGHPGVRARRPTSCCRWRRCPTVDFPTITVTAQLPGASPDTMASSVATPLEQQFAAIPGLAQMTSTSGLGIDHASRCSSTSTATSTAPRRTCRPRSTRPAACCPRTCPTRRPTRRPTRPTAPILIYAV